MRWLSPGRVELRVDLNTRDDENAVRVPGSLAAGWLSVGDSVLVSDEDGEVRGRAIVVRVDAGSGASTLAVAWDTMRRVEGEYSIPWPFSIAAGNRLRQVTSVTDSEVSDDFVATSTNASVGDRSPDSMSGNPAIASGGVPMRFTLEQGR